MYIRSVRLFFFQAEDGIRDLVRSRGLGDVYKRQAWVCPAMAVPLNCHWWDIGVSPTAVTEKVTACSLSLIHI